MYIFKGCNVQKNKNRKEGLIVSICNNIQSIPLEGIILIIFEELKNVKSDISMALNIGFILACCKMIIFAGRVCEKLILILSSFLSFFGNEKEKRN